MNRRFLIILISLVLGFCLSCNTNKVECYGNCYTGFGEKKWSDGGHDKGNWKEGEMVGYGEQYFGSTSEFAGDTYAGQFGEGGYNGYGKYYSKKSDGLLVGYWKKGKPNGYGKSTLKIHSPNPLVYYEGNWKDGKPGGFGKMNFDNGKIKYKYEGDFVDGLFDGMGDFYPPDGTHYKGHFTRGFKDGEGVIYFNEGKIIYAYKGTWINDESEGFEKFKRSADRGLLRSPR